MVAAGRREVAGVKRERKGKLSVAGLQAADVTRKLVVRRIRGSGWRASGELLQSREFGFS